MQNEVFLSQQNGPRFFYVSHFQLTPHEPDHWRPTINADVTVESSITAKRWNSRMRAESCRQAADVAAARCARHDASHISDAFEHLLWLHSCSGSLEVMNARRLSHLKKAGASAALEIARQDVLADIREHISLSTLDMAQCVSDFGTVNTVDMQVCASFGTLDSDDPYSRAVIRRLKCTSARLQPFILFILYSHRRHSEDGFNASSIACCSFYSFEMEN